MLGKRSPPQQEQKQLALLKQQNITSALQPIGCQHLDCKRVALLMTVTCAACSRKAKDAMSQCTGCKKYVCSPCQLAIGDRAEDALEEDEAEMELDLDQ